MYKFIKDLIPSGWTSQKKNSFLRHYTSIKTLGKWKTSKNSLIKEFTSPFNLIVLNNATNLSNTFHGQTSLKNTVFSVKKSFDGYIFPVWYKLIHFSFPLNTAVHRTGNAAKILCPSLDVENNKSLNPILYFVASSPKAL